MAYKTCNTSETRQDRTRVTIDDQQQVTYALSIKWSQNPRRLWMTLKRAIKYSVSKVRNTHYVFRIRSQNLETNHKNLNVKCSQCKASVRLYVLVVIRSCRCRRREMNHRRKPSYIGFFVGSAKVFVCAVSVHINQSPVAVSQSSPPREIRPAIGKGALCARTPRALGKRNSAAATGRNFQSGPSVLSPSHVMLIEN